MEAAACQDFKLLFSFPVRESGKRPLGLPAGHSAGMNHELCKAREQRLQSFFETGQEQPSFQIKTPEMIRRFQRGSVNSDTRPCSDPAKPLCLVIQQGIVSIYGS
jgi:hypothetical protein